MDHAREYSRKVVSAEEAVGAVKSGDWVQYGHHANSPVYLDGFLAKRKDELGTSRYARWSSRAWRR